MSRTFKSQGLVITSGTNGAAGTNTLITPQYGGQRVRVVSLALIATAASTIQFEGGSTAITGAFSVTANSGMVLPYNPDGWFETNPNTGTASSPTVNNVLKIIVGGTGPVEGVINYVVV